MIFLFFVEFCFFCVVSLDRACFRVGFGCCFLVFRFVLVLLSVLESEGIERVLLEFFYYFGMFF